MEKKNVEPKSDFLTILKKAPESSKIAGFYGFYPVVGPKIKKEDLDLTKEMDKEWKPEAKASMLREFCNTKNMSLPQPLMLWTGESRSANKVECSLSILNSGKSITEAIIIQTARAILDHAGFKNTFVRINSVGNKDSVAEFDRKMNNFLRKRFNEFPPELRQNLKKDTYYLAKSKEEKYKAWREAMPQSIDCLNEESRIHFKEILEYLEYLDIPYVIDGSLLGDLTYATETVFEIISEEEILLARGCRYNRLSKRLQYKKELGAVDIRISAKSSKAQKIFPVKENKHKFYLVQFGPEAKLKSLIVLEKLRKAGVSVFHSLVKDKLTGQILSAESMGIPYIILLGQKEALENCVVIRNVSTRSQISVFIESLGEHVRTMK